MALNRYKVQVRVPLQLTVIVRGEDIVQAHSRAKKLAQALAADTIITAPDDILLDSWELLTDQADPYQFSEVKDQ